MIHIKLQVAKRPLFRGELRKSVQKFLGLPFCCTVEHVQLKNVTVDVMIIVTTTVCVKCAPECIKMHHFLGENRKIFWRGAQPPPKLHPTEEGNTTSQIPLPSAPSRVGDRGASIQVPLALEPPDQISGYGPGEKLKNATRGIVLSQWMRLVG